MNSHLHAVLPISISLRVDSMREAEMSPPAYKRSRRVMVSVFLVTSRPNNCERTLLSNSRKCVLSRSDKA